MANTSATGGYLVPTSALPAEGDALDDIFTEAIAGITGLDGTLVRPKWQVKPPNRPAVDVDWCGVGVTENASDAGPVIVHDPNGGGGLGSDEYSRQKDITVLASFYGPNGKSFAQLLEDGLSIPQNLETLQENSIYFVSTSTIRAVPESVNMQYVKRFDLLVYFRRGVARTYAVETIQTAGVELHVEDKIVNIDVEPQP